MTALDRLLSQPVTVRDRTLGYDDRALVTRTDGWTALDVPPVPYAFTSRDDRVRLGWLATMSLAALRSGRVVLKTTHEPTDVAGWLGGLDRSVRERGEPAVGWPAYRDGQGARVAATQGTGKRVTALVRLGGRPLWAQTRRSSERAGGMRLPLPLLPGEWSGWERAAGRVRGTLGQGGLAATGVDAARLRALRRLTMTATSSAVRPSASGRERWDGPALADEFADVELRVGPRWVQVDSEGGRRLAATLVCSVFPQEMAFPDVEPWLAHLDRLDGFTVGSDLVLDLVEPRRAKAHVRERLRGAQDQRQDAERAGVDLPIETAEMLRLARELEYRIPSMRLPLAYGWARIRVAADSPAELEDRCRAVREHMGAIGGAGIDVAWPGGRSQLDLHLEGVPGFPVRSRSWRQRWPLETAACSLPHAASGLGHESGSYRGWATGRQRQAVRIDLHHPITRRSEADLEGAGGVALLGVQRAGKSSALAQIVYDATQAGTIVGELDPSGPQARIARLPEFAGRAETFDLLEHGRGIADPLGAVLIPDPPRPDVGGLDRGRAVDVLSRWEMARGRARQERERLARETLHTLAWRQYDKDADAETEALRAIRRVSLSQSESGMLAVVAELRRSSGKAARNLAEHLAFEFDADEAGALTGEGAAPITAGGVTTRIVSMRGMVLPEAGKPMREWMPAEQLGAATFGCGAHLMRRLLFALPPDVLKLFVVDEAHVPMATQAGRRVIEGALRDGPKHGLVTVLATHNVVDLGDERVLGAISQWFLFRATAAAELGRSFEAARIEDSAGNRALRRGLRNGECIAVLDTDVRDRFRWDLWPSGLAEAARTTPTGVRLEKVA